MSTVRASLPPVAKPGTPRLLSRRIGFGTLAAAAEAQPPTAPRPHAELDRHPLHLARRLAALRAPLPRARLAQAPRRVPGRPHAQLARLPRPRHRARPPRRDRPRRLLPRLSRPRPLPARSRLEELLGPGRAQRRARFHGHEGPGPRRRHRHLARRAHRHADGRAASRRDGRRGPQRHRPRHRARGARPHRRLRRARAAARQLAGGDRAHLRDEPAPVHRRAGRSMGGRRPPALQRRQRPALSLLRPQARQGDLGHGRPHARAVAAVRRPLPRAGARRPRRELRHPGRQDAGRDAGPPSRGSPPSRSAARVTRRCSRTRPASARSPASSPAPTGRPTRRCRSVA